MKNRSIIAYMLVLVCMPAKATAAIENDVMVTGADTIVKRMVDLDELVVVSQPKENRRLRYQPVAGSMFTEKEMTGLGISDLSSLSAYIPSCSMPAYGSRLTSSMYIRGIGSRSGSPAVGVYYDGIPLISKSAVNSHFYQTDRVDVLRGPQGTLYGINAEGGLVRVYSKNPLNYQGTDIRAGLGTGLYSNAEVAHYHRPNDRLAFSTAVFYSGQRGFFRNTLLDGRADLTNEAGGKARLIWLPSQRLKIDLTADYQYVNQNGFAYGQYDISTGKFDEPSTNIMNGYRRNLLNTGLNVSYDMGTLRLVSVTSWQYLHDLMQMDQDYLPEDYLRLEQREHMNAIVQELTLDGNVGNKWRHVSGVFFSHQWLHTEAPVFFGEAMNKKILGSMGIPPVVSSALTITDNRVPGKFETPVTNIGIFHESNIDITPRLMATLGLRYDYQRVGIDYDTYSHFTLENAGMPQMHIGASAHSYTSLMQNKTTKSYNQLLPKVALTYRMNDAGSNVYATVSKGFRAGGYNLQMFSDIFQSELRSKGKEMMVLMNGDMSVEHDAEDYSRIDNTISYEPETSINYEVGAHLNLFGGRVNADFSAFCMRINDQQLSVMADRYGYGRMMVNAGRSRSLGAEVAFRGNAFGGRMTWAATYSWVQSTFRRYTDSVTVATDKGLATEKRDYRGNHVPFVPQHNFSIMADWRMDISQNGLLRSMVLGVDLCGNGKTYWDVDNQYSQKAYATLGAHVMLDFGSVNVNLWGRNLTDTKYNTFLVNSAIDGVSRSFAQRGNPLRFGVDVSLHI